MKECEFGNSYPKSSGWTNLEKILKQLKNDALRSFKIANLTEDRTEQRY